MSLHAALKITAAAVALALLAVACGGGGSADERSPAGDSPTGARPSGDAEAEPEVPLHGADAACVPAEEIFFDTFNGGVTPLDKATPELIERLRDAIPPLDNPAYESVDEASWLGDGDVVLGYADGDEAYAYPILILNYHEIVNEEINGRPVLISYCPLCASGIAYDRRLDGETLTFGNTSALYESDLVMYDHQTGSYWQQVLGEGIVGPMCGEQLEVLPLHRSTWFDWRQMHPDTLVLSRETGYGRNYERDPFSGFADVLSQGRFPFPVGDTASNGPLAPADMVLTIRREDGIYAYSLTGLMNSVVNDRLGEEPVVVFSRADGPAGAAFVPVADGQQLTFDMRARTIVDVETGSTWSMEGEAVDGPLRGSQLEPIPARVTFWYAIVATTPEVEVRAP